MNAIAATDPIAAANAAVARASRGQGLTMPDDAPATPPRHIRTKGEQVRDIIFSCGRYQLVEVATTLKAEAPHELAILMAALKDLGL